MAALTFERYLCLKENQLVVVNKQKVKLFITYITFLWIFAISFALTKTLYIKQVYHKDAGKYACGSTFNAKYKQIYTILQWIIAFVFPYSIIIIFSSLLLKFLHNWSMKSISLHSAPKKQNNEVIQEEPFEMEKLVRSQISSQSKRNNLGNNIFSGGNDPAESILLNNSKCCLNSTYSLPIENSASALVRISMIKRRSTRFVLAVVISFLCTWSPFWIYQIIISFTEFQSIFLVIMHNLTLVCTYIEGVLDPLFYILLTENFRDFISKLNCCSKKVLNDNDTLSLSKK